MNQENHGVDMDYEGMKQGTESGAKAGGNKIAEQVMLVADSQSVY